MGDIGRKRRRIEVVPSQTAEPTTTPQQVPEPERCPQREPGQVPAPSTS